MAAFLWEVISKSFAAICSYRLPWKTRLRDKLGVSLVKNTFMLSKQPFRRKPNLADQWRCLSSITFLLATMLRTFVYDSYFARHCHLALRGILKSFWRRLLCFQYAKTLAYWYVLLWYLNVEFNACLKSFKFISWEFFSSAVIFQARVHDLFFLQ